MSLIFWVFLLLLSLQDQKRRGRVLFHMTSAFDKIWQVKRSGIFTLQITDMTNLHWIKIIDVLHNYYIKVRKFSY